MTSVNGHSSVTPQPSRPRYVAPHRGRRTRSCALVWCPGTPAEQRYVFYDQIEIGRHDELVTRPGGAYARLHQLQLLDDRAETRQPAVERAEPTV